ncbi:putative transmembrane protein [Phytophthora cinnamomi]|uniref:putative transmembrane protein n=1 Tax=Phytophthora cinnamomi TaxID=4785 RepID=UPI003559847D|nr:putative transmembrane protein [Phytophthora cinnamomi]
MVSSAGEGGSTTASLQVSAAAYMEVASPRAPSSATSSRAVNLRRRKIEIEIVEGVAPKGPTWQFPASGSSEHVQVPQGELQEIQKELEQPRKLLGELPATSISGNDILSSVLYSASSVAAKSGKLMPIPLLMVSTVLFFFRFIYEEVVTAIPMNGGTYNALLNTTSKRTAAVAACLSILSYVATGVVSATSGVRYLNNQVSIPIVGSTIILLGAFAVLAVIGITESSRVAVGIFLHHIVVLSILFVSCVVYGIQHPHVFKDNMHVSYPEVDFAGSMLDGNVFTAIFFGFGASMLGITGFESSSNYVEEQKPGVFRKTLRNMWALVTFFNVGLGAGILAVLPLEGDGGIYASSDDLLAMVGREAVGSWFETWICIDAFVVLSGAVLTSYVGICGLVRRLSTDRVLPAFLAKTNKLRGTNHYIIGLYFALSSSLVLILNADATTVNGVYTYAFLGLMAMFSCACMLLKGKRSEIPRDIHAPWTTVIIGFILVVVAIFSNLLGDPSVLMYFALYFIVVMCVMFIMFERVTILRCILVIMQKMAPSRYGKAAAIGLANNSSSEIEHTGARGGRTIARTIVSIRDAPIVFFCKIPDLTIINKAIIYVRRNEQTHTLRIVHVFADEEADAPVLASFREMAALFDSMYPKIRVDFVSVRGEFGPAMIEWLSRSMKVPRNMMFITQPDLLSAERVSTVGVRVITA